MLATILDLLKGLVGRGTQLVARYAGVGLAALAVKLGAEVPADSLEGAAGVVATLVGAGVAMLLDHLQHKVLKEKEKEAK